MIAAESQPTEGPAASWPPPVEADALPTLPPGPTAPALVQSLRFSLRRLEFMGECFRRYGDCFTLRLLGQAPIVNFSHPDAIKDIFTGDPEVLAAGEASRDFLGPIVGWRSLLVLDGPRHRRERRLMTPPFHGERMQAYGRVMRDVTDRDIDAWPAGRSFAVHPHMQAITLEVIMRAVFGLDDGPEFRRLRDCLLRILALADSPAAAFLAIPALRIDGGRLTPWGRFVRDREAFRAIIVSEIARRRAEPSDSRSDILSLLVAARDEHGEPMSDDELFDEMFTLLMAGHETTATSLAWALYHVLGRPDVLDHLRAELRQHTGNGPAEPEHATRLEYLDAVIKETARLTPTFTNVIRRLRAPVRIGGRALPAGVNVSPCIYLTHRRPDLWSDPERFDPDRFVGVRPSPYTFFPFGGGERRCLGSAFATYEMKIVLARVLSRVALRLAPGYRMRPVLRTVALAPSDGLPVVIDGQAP